MRSLLAFLVLVSVPWAPSPSPSEASPFPGIHRFLPLGAESSEELEAHGQECNDQWDGGCNNGKDGPASSERSFLSAMQSQLDTFFGGNRRRRKQQQQEDAEERRRRRERQEAAAAAVSAAAARSSSFSPADNLLPSRSFCGRRPAVTRPSGRIVGGETAQEGAFPWQAQLLKAGSNSKGVSTGLVFQCGGSLVREDLVVTAGHCFKTQDPDEYRVFLGRHKRDSTVKECAEQRFRGMYVEQ